MFTFLIVLAIVFVLVAAFKYLTAAGDPEKVKSASHTLIYAAVAVVIAILAKGVPLIIGSLFNVTFTGC
jgi:formate-dependent nitrite reductase membrane component NrfD